MTNARKSGQPLGVKQRRYGDVATKILAWPSAWFRRGGYNGFSYADIAATMGVTKASLHYHFASKEALGCALIECYAQAFMGCSTRYLCQIVQHLTRCVTTSPYTSQSFATNALVSAKC